MKYIRVYVHRCMCLWHGILLNMYLTLILLGVICCLEFQFVCVGFYAVFFESHARYVRTVTRT